MENNAKERAMDILKPLIYTKSVQTEGHFAVDSQNTYNVFANMSTDEAFRRVLSMNQELRNEIKGNPELADAIVEILATVTAPKDYTQPSLQPRI